MARCGLARSKTGQRGGFMRALLRKFFTRKSLQMENGHAIISAALAIAGSILVDGSFTGAIL
jgi:hypothetical protein